MNIDFNKYKRVFIFGCSFTRWHYPTWANILHQSMPNTVMFNLGKGGGGNSFISNRMTQANRTYNFCETDLVTTMWSTLCREDRFFNNQWHTVGNIFTQGEYDEKFVKKFCDPLGYLIKDLSIIDLATTYMSTLPCDYIDLLAVPFNHQCEEYINDEVYKNVLYTYRDLISHFDKPNMLSILGQFSGGLSYLPDWGHTGHPEESEFVDYHPNPDQYYKFLHSVGFPLTQSSADYAEEAYKKAKTVKISTEFVTAFPEIQPSLSPASKYYTYQHWWKIEL